jgi:hypothetical protein
LEKARTLLETVRTKRVRTVIDLVIIILIAIIVFRNFIFLQEWPAGGDALGFISREYIYGKDYNWLYVWRPNSFGYPEGINLLDFFFMFLRFAAGSAANTVKVFAFSSFAVAGFAMYAFGYHYSKKHLAALAGAFIYILNQAYFTQLTEAHLDLMFSYALAPLIFLFFDNALETRKTKYVVTGSFLVAIMLTSFHPQAMLIYGGFLALFLIIKLIPPWRSSFFSDTTKRLLKSILIIGALAALLSAVAWVPLLFNVKALYLTPGFTRGSLEDTYTYGYTTFQDAFTLAGKEFGGYVVVVDVTRNVSLQLLPVSTILLLVFAVAYVTTLVFKLDCYSIFFALAALISILISMGPYSPFKNSFLWAWFNIPYFQSLRAVSRVALMTAFANSFFVCASVSVLTGYFRKIASAPKEDQMENKVKAQNYPARMSKRITLPSLKRISGFTRRFLYYLAILILVGMFLSGFLSTWFLFSNGLQVWSPPSSYVAPYEYLANIPGEYKIVTVGRSQEDWFSAQGNDTDFLGGMLTPIGWSHDLGYESSFIHNKPVLQEGGLSSRSLDFVNYLRFQLAGNNITRNMLKILGAFDYKYIVIPSYATENLQSFFMSQDGAKVVYDQNESIILENDFQIARLYAPKQSALVFGGSESLSSLFDLESFDLGQTALVPADQGDNFDYIVDSLLSQFSMIVFTSADESDLIIRPSNDVCLVYAADYGVSSTNATEYWISDLSHTYAGETVLGGKVLSTSGSNAKSVPFRIETEGDYEIYLRVGFAPNRGKLLVSVDSFPIAEITPYCNFSAGLKWVNLAPDLHLETGSHLVTLTNDGSGYNDVDAIAIVEQAQLKEKEEELLELFRTYDGNILYLFEAEREFLQKTPSPGSVVRYPGEGYALQIEGGLDVSPLGVASASSVSDSLGAKYAIDGNALTRWASSPGVPQWLEIEWPTPQELRGVKIRFEYAYAKDYQVQTWNGTGWVDQVTVVNNALLDRSHTFSQPVTTKKLRILVTSAPAHDMVSIYEFDAYSSQNMTSSEILVPKEGQYSFAARLFSTQEPNATFFLKVDENLFSIPSPTDANKVGWYEMGSAFLDAGEHTIGIASSGEVALDKIGIYHTPNESRSILQVFEPDVSAPSVRFEKINPTKYVAHVGSASPFLLTFSEAYHPLWKAYVDGEEISSVVTNFLVNGFYINKTGNFDVTIYFTGQTYADAGLIISGLSAFFIVIVAAAKLLPLKKLGNIVKNRLKLPKMPETRIQSETEKQLSGQPLFET